LSEVADAMIEAGSKMWPEANIGVCTGAVSGLVVLDVDAPKGGVESLVGLEQSYHSLPETVQQLTGRGQHYVFAHPGAHVKNGVQTLGPGLDIRGDGGYIIAAPSLHETGRRYAWEIVHDPEDVALAPMPNWLLALCRETRRRDGISAGDPIPRGKRNDTLFRVGCGFRARGCSESVILAALRAMNDSQCHPPLTDEEVAHIASSCAHYEAGTLQEDVQRRRNGPISTTEATDLDTVEHLWETLKTTPAESRTVDMVFEHVAVLGTIPPVQWPLWKNRFKDLVPKLNLNDLQRTYTTLQRQQARVSRRSPTDPRPTIRLTPDLQTLADEGQQALLHLPEAPIYQRAKRLVILSPQAPKLKWLPRPPEMATITLLSRDHLRELASRAARWEEYSKTEEDYVEITAPFVFVDTLLARPSSAFPVLEGILQSPTIRPDGHLLTRPGYDTATGLYLDFPDTTFPPVSTHPTQDKVATALTCLKEPLRDFPFTASHHRSAALAAILALVCRFAIPGPVPLFAIRANTRGSGKSLLADVISLIGTGRPAPRWPQVTDDEEERKRLLAVALAGYPAIHIDNVVRPLGHPRPGHGPHGVELYRPDFRQD